MDEYGDFEQENYWEDDLYILNQNEADDYRHEMDDSYYEQDDMIGGDSDLMGEF